MRGPCDYIVEVQTAHFYDEEAKGFSGTSKIARKGTQSYNRRTDWGRKLTESLTFTRFPAP